MIKVEKSTIVHRPSDEVFAFVADQTNAARWQSGIVEVRRLTDGPPGVGTRHTFTRTLMGKRMTGENEYVAFEPGKQVAFRTTSGPRLLASYAVTATPGGHPPHGDDGGGLLRDHVRGGAAGRPGAQPGRRREPRAPHVHP